MKECPDVLRVLGGSHGGKSGSYFLVLQVVEARGKNLLLRFEGGYVLRNHLRMSGSWRVLPLSADVPGRALAKGKRKPQNDCSICGDPYA